MSTAQLSGKLYSDCTSPRIRTSGVDSYTVAKKEKTSSRSTINRIIIATVRKLERIDTFADRVAGYGLCSLALVYLTAHVIKAAF